MFSDFQNDYLTWLHSQGFPKQSEVFVGTFTDFISIIQNSGKLLITYYLGNLYSAGLETETNIKLSDTVEMEVIVGVNEIYI